MTFLNQVRDDRILILTMSQPESRNALTGGTAIAEFVKVCDDVRRDASLRAVILTGAGTVFSSGGNLKDMLRYEVEQLAPDVIREELRVGIQQLTRAVYQMDVPLIAAVNGPAIGAGLDLACMCDIRIAADTATFAESFVKVGIVPGDGGAWLLPRIVGIGRASEMAFTGDSVSAQVALAWGLISRVVPAGELMSQSLELARRIASNPGSALRMTKRLLRESHQASLDCVLEMSAAYQGIAHASADHHEAVRAFLEKRQPRFR